MNDSVSINKHLGLGGNDLVCAWPFSTAVISLVQPQLVSGQLLCLQSWYGRGIMGFWTDIKFHCLTLDSIWQWGDIFASAHETQSSQCLTGSLSHQPVWWGCLGHHCESNVITCSSLVTQWLRAQGFLGFSVPGWQKYDNQDCSYRRKPSSEEYSKYVNLDLSSCGGPLQ